MIAFLEGTIQSIGPDSLVLRVGGIGYQLFYTDAAPRMAQKILRAAPRESLYTHIQQGDVAFLTQVQGVGTKTAQKIILELQGVLVSLEGASPQDNDTVEALMSLGYTRSDAQQVAGQLSSESMEDRIREALQLLGA